MFCLCCPCSRCKLEQCFWQTSGQKRAQPNILGLLEVRRLLVDSENQSTDRDVLSVTLLFASSLQEKINPVFYLKKGTKPNTEDIVMRSSLTRINRYAGLQLSQANGFKEVAASIQGKITGSSNMISSIRSHSTMLAEVGRFVVRQSEEICYPAGQPFLHRVFGYRGVILFPWPARVHDIDMRKQCPDDGLESHQSNPHPTTDGKLSSSSSKTTETPNGGFQSVRSKQSKSSTKGNEQYQSSASGNQHLTRFHPYYQVLIDVRDCPYVSNRTQTEVTTPVGMSWILGHADGEKSVVGSIKGLDYVAHEDILPYTSHEEQPIQHELHNRLFKYDPDAIPLGGSKFMPSERLESWKKRHTSLELSRVYRETTENVRVTVIPFYLGHSTIEDTYWWRYCVRLENFSDSSVQLRERHWKIFSQKNMLQTIKGRGVVGSEPLLTKKEPAFQYSSHVNLEDKSGHMWGTFKMQRVDGYTFECRIPAFSLESSIDVTTPPRSKRHTRDDNNDDDSTKV